MAEARAAVSLPSAAVHRYGHEIDTSSRAPQVHIGTSGFILYIPPPLSLARQARRKFWGAILKAKAAFAPIPLPLVCLVVGGATYWAVNATPPHAPLIAIDGAGGEGFIGLTSSLFRLLRKGDVKTFLSNVSSKVESASPFASRFPKHVRVGYLTAMGTTAVVALMAAFQRQCLSMLLSYHGWLYERNHKSLKTKIWNVLLTAFFKVQLLQEPLDAYDGAMPKLPLPAVKDTVANYLTSMEPLLDDTEMTQLRDEAEVFLRKDAWKLQFYLRIKHFLSKNYMSDWWRDFVYLRGRGPIAIDSNWFGISYMNHTATPVQIAHAAAAIREFLLQRTRLAMGTFPPTISGGLVPLCMDQYKYVFNTTRIPGAEADELRQTSLAESRHVVVLYRGLMYRVQCYTRTSGRLLTAFELQATLQGIVDDHYEGATPAEKYIPALTCIDRPTWAHVRDQCFLSNSTNFKALKAIENAAFIVSLDSDASGTLAEEAKSYLTGNGFNRWMDKSFNLVFKADGRGGCNVEHSWGDAPTFAHVNEYAQILGESGAAFDETGNCKIQPEDEHLHTDKYARFYAPERLVFDMTKALSTAAIDAHNQYTKRVDNLHLHIESFEEYGKAVAKKTKCSPDAWAQMAMQLAIYRNTGGKFVQTYEPSMTRLFRRGRTETIRSLSNESKAFVLAMEDSTMTDATRLEFLRKACDSHQTRSHDAMCGKGLDRHMFAMYVVSVGKEMPNKFLEKVLSQKWKLSTSQVPIFQLPPEMHSRSFDADKLRGTGGGFGPVADDGYGILYVLYDDNRMYFTITSQKSCPTTDAEKFGKDIAQSLRDLKNMATRAGVKF